MTCADLSVSCCLCDSRCDAHECRLQRSRMHWALRYFSGRRENAAQGFQTQHGGVGHTEERGLCSVLVHIEMSIAK
jgi:hypothetical protein